MSYLIRFAFPDNAQDWYAALLDDGLGFTLNRDDALTWDDHTSAVNTLRNGYGDGTRPCGVVEEA